MNNTAILRRLLAVPAVRAAIDMKQGPTGTGGGGGGGGGTTPLMLAALVDSTEGVALLLAAGASVTLRTRGDEEYEENALTVALCGYSSPSLVRALIDAGAVESVDDLQFAMHQAWEARRALEKGYGLHNRAPLQPPINAATALRRLDACDALLAAQCTRGPVTLEFRKLVVDYLPPGAPRTFLGGVRVVTGEDGIGGGGGDGHSPADYASGGGAGRKSAKRTTKKQR